MAYRTKQGQALLDYLQTLGGAHVSANEIAVAMPGKIGLTTVYRQLEKLVEQGQVRKYTTEGEAACYQYVGEGSCCRDHYHMMCAACGKLIHVECEEMDRLAEHLYAHHGFRTDPLRTALYGTCRECLEREELQ